MVYSGIGDCTSSFIGMNEEHFKKVEADYIKEIINLLNDNISEGKVNSFGVGNESYLIREKEIKYLIDSYGYSRKESIKMLEPFWKREGR